MSAPASEPAPAAAPPGRPPQGAAGSLLALIERVGNRLPDPAALFVVALLITWALSAVLAPVAFDVVDPRDGKPLVVRSLLARDALVASLLGMVKTFTSFHPLGVVLVTLLGVGVAEHAGLVRAGVRWLLEITPRRLLTPTVILVAIVSHSAADAGFVLVVPVGAIVFRAAGRHPLAGLAAAFAGVSGGFSANFVPSGLDVLLQGFTQSAAQILEPGRVVNPLCNWYFMTASCLVIVALGWWITDRVVEPRLATVVVDGDEADTHAMERLAPRERRALIVTAIAAVLFAAGVGALTVPAGAPLRSAGGSLTTNDAPLMQAIVPLIFLFFLITGCVYGGLAGTLRSHRDAIAGASKAMSEMGYYLVLAFLAAQFIDAFGRSNLGALCALEGALGLRALGLPPAVTIVGIVFVGAFLDLFIGSASAKWALLAPIMVPMLMAVGFSPELVQAAYRIGDSTSNIISPLMPYFPLVLVYARRYVKPAGIGTLVSLMLPYSVAFIVAWTALLLAWWGLGLPLGIG
jgi:aminobenzoyl-glutamate transport protein